jgi:hypothetical protein
MKNIFVIQCLLCASALLLSCCKSSISVSDLQPKGEFTQKLPLLIPVFDVYPTVINPFLVTLGASIDSAVRQPILLPPVLDSSETRGIRTSYVQDANANELLVFFARDVERNMTKNTGRAKGYISCKVTALETPNPGSGWALLHGCTLGAATLMGVPIYTCRASIEIEVVVRDKYSNPIRRYWGIANAKKYAGLYYGYRLPDLPRATKLAAFKKALDSVKDQIEMDFYRLEKELR